MLLNLCWIELPKASKHRENQGGIQKDQTMQIWKCTEIARTDCKCCKWICWNVLADDQRWVHNLQLWTLPRVVGFEREGSIFLSKDQHGLTKTHKPNHPVPLDSFDVFQEMTKKHGVFFFNVLEGEIFIIVFLTCKACNCFFFPVQKYSTHRQTIQVLPTFLGKLVFSTFLVQQRRIWRKCVGRWKRNKVSTGGPVSEYRNIRNVPSCAWSKVCLNSGNILKYLTNTQSVWPVHHCVYHYVRHGIYFFSAGHVCLPLWNHDLLWSQPTVWPWTLSFLLVQLLLSIIREHCLTSSFLWHSFGALFE